MYTDLSPVALLASHFLLQHQTIMDCELQDEDGFDCLHVNSKFDQPMSNSHQIYIREPPLKSWRAQGGGG